MRWEDILSQISEMGRKISNLNETASKLTKEYSWLTSERKKYERTIANYNDRIDRLNKSLSDVTDSIRIFSLKRRDELENFQVTEYNIFFEKGINISDEDTAFHLERLEKIAEQIKSLINSSYQDPENLSKIQIEEKVGEMNDMIFDISKKLPSIQERIIEVKNEIKKSNHFIDTRILRETTVADLIVSINIIWITVIYRILQPSTKNVFSNTIFFCRKEEDDVVKWYRLRDRVRSLDKPVKTSRRIEELERLLKESKQKRDEDFANETGGPIVD